MKEWWLAQNEEEEADEFIPAALKKETIVKPVSTYIELEQKDCAVDLCVERSAQVDVAIQRSLAPTFLESLVKFDSAFVFITQFEVYYRNNVNVDASAIATPHEPYHESPVAIIKNKNEKGKEWFELSIFYKRYELLITGGIVGENTSSQLTPFLGPSVSFKKMTSSNQKATEKIIVLETGPAFDVRERKLRNWAKSSSFFKWAVFSKRFSDKGFSTTDPLRISNTRNKTANLSSFVLRCISENQFTEVDYKTMMDLLFELPVAQSVEKFRKVAQLKKKITKNNPKYDITLLNILEDLENNINKNPRSTLQAEATVHLSNKIFTYCKGANKKALAFTISKQQTFYYT